MTLDDLTDLLSRIGRRNPEIMQPRDARLLIEAILDEGRKLPRRARPQDPIDSLDI